MTLEDLLRRNYDRIVDPHCKPLIIGFVRVTESIALYSLSFAKRLTKVGTNLTKIALADMEDLVLERLFIYNLEGSSRIRQGETASFSSPEIPVIRAHFEGHAASMAGLLYQRTYDVRWAEQHFLSSGTAGDLASSCAPPYAAQAYAFATQSAETLFKITREEKWARQAYASAQRNLAYRKDHKMNNIKLAEMVVATSALDLHVVTGDISFARCAYDLLQELSLRGELSFSQRHYIHHLLAQASLIVS